MQITHLESQVEHIKPQSEAQAYAGAESLTYVRCRVTTDDGITGDGVTGRFLADQVAHLLNGGIADTLKGLKAISALDIEALTTTLAKKFNPRQSTGVFVSAMSALDLALWDIKGKALGQPVARLIGGARNAVPAYATVGLPAYTEAELIKACKSALAEGFQGAKILVGAGRSIAEDAQRIRAVRAAIGAAPLMLDANCAYTVAEAKRLAEQVADCDIAFFEEPLRGNDIASLAELRRAIKIPLASGQMIQSVTWFRDVLAAGALDILQPNAAFCGGITAMLRIMALAEAHGVPVTGAGGFESANLPVMAGHAHGGMLEVHGAHVAIKARFATHPVFANGKLLAPDVPGLGLSLKD
jgi:L-rhamnonate dehydratase